MPQKRPFSALKKKKKDPNNPFPTQKVKLGRKKAKPSSYTNLDIKSKGIYVPTQNLRTDEEAELIEEEKNYVTSRNLSLSDIVQQLKHYNSNVVREAIKSLKELVQLHPKSIKLYFSKIVQETSPIILFYGERKVNEELLELYTFLFNNLQYEESFMNPHLELLMIYIASALTNLDYTIRFIGLDFLLLLVKNFPIGVSQYAVKVLPNIESIFQTNDVSHNYTGNQYKNMQRKCLQVLHLYLQHLFANNMLKMELREDTPHIHVSTTSMVDSIKTEFIFSAEKEEEEEDKKDALFAFAKVDSQVYSTFLKIMQRKTAQFSSHYLSVSNKQQQQQQAEQTEEKSILLEKYYNLESAEHVTTFFSKLYSQVLIKYWLEFVGGTSEKKAKQIESTKDLSSLKQIIDIIYMCLYALEHSLWDVLKKQQSSEWMKQCLQIVSKQLHYIVDSFPLLGSVTFSEQENHILFSTNITIMSVLSFLFGTEYAQRWELIFLRFLNQVLEKMETLSEDNLMQLLGTIYRIYGRIDSKPIRLQLWKHITRCAGQCKLLSNKQLALIQFFSQMAIEESNIPSEILLQWTQHLTQLLNPLHESEESEEKNSLIRIIFHVLLSLEKKSQLFSQDMEQLIQTSLLQLLQQSTPLQHQEWTHLIPLFYFFHAIPQELSKALLQQLMLSGNLEICCKVIEVLKWKYQTHPQSIPLHSYLSLLMQLMHWISKQRQLSETNVETLMNALHELYLSIQMIDSKKWIPFLEKQWELLQTKPKLFNSHYKAYCVLLLGLYDTTEKEKQKWIIGLWMEVVAFALENNMNDYLLWAIQLLQQNTSWMNVLVEYAMDHCQETKTVQVLQFVLQCNGLSEQIQQCQQEFNLLHQKLHSVENSFEDWKQVLAQWDTWYQVQLQQAEK